MIQSDSHLHEQQSTTAGSKPRLRFAPSPTGLAHVGAYRTALFSWPYARHTGGTFILRMGVTDEARTVEGAVVSLIEARNWAGMDIGEGPPPGGPNGPYYQRTPKAR